jgi:predicted nucleotidyltransferase
MLKEYETQSTLNPKLWDDTSLKPDLRVKFTKIAKYFYDFLDINVTVKDIILIGSNANYNWTEHSDIDLHVVIDYQAVNKNLHLVKNYMLAKKSLWNTNYPLTYQGMAIELYAQDANEELHSSVGEYSILNDKWIKQPSSKIITVDDDIIDQKARPIEYQIDALQESDPKLEIKIQNILLHVRRMRQTGLESEGEYSIENLAYKKLRNSGHLERLKQLLNLSTMGSLDANSPLQEAKGGSCIESLAKHVAKKYVMTETDWNAVMKETDAVEDAMGQWKHPGRCTMIPSNQITMKNVAYPVLGIDDTGHSKIMHPEQEYVYPGNRVFEIPMNGQQQTLLMQIRNAITDWNSL